MGLFSKDFFHPKIKEDENPTDGETCFQLGKKAYHECETIEKAVEYYRRGAEQFEHGDCQYVLGRLYLLLKIAETPNLGLVVHWYKKAINNNVYGYELPLTIALIYLFGDKDIKNETEALKWIEKAVENNPECYTVIGDAYYAGGVPFRDRRDLLSVLKIRDAVTRSADPPEETFIELKSVGRDYVKALDWYLKAAKVLPPKEAPATKIALIYLHGGHGVEKNYQKALDWTERFWGEIRKTETETVKVIMAVYREGGYGVEKDVQKALNYCLLDNSWPLSIDAGEIYQFYTDPPNFEKAALYYENALRWDRSLASERLGYLYLKGLGVKINYPRAKQLLGGDTYYVGYFLHYGIKATFNYDLALSHYERCETGNKFYGRSLNQIGLIHQARSEDFGKAIELFKRAAEENCYDAFNSLGDVYKNGYGVDVDYEEAFKWYSRAAEEPRDNGGQFNLAVMYSEGKGTQIDYKLALHLFQKAKNYGNDLESQMKNNHIGVQVPQNKELPKMFYVENKQR
ncbi:unnamed protein product [Mucor hiemalis]